MLMCSIDSPARQALGATLKRRYFYGYNIVAAGFFIQLVAIGAMFTYGVFFKHFQAEFGWSRATISGASSLAFLIMGIGGTKVDTPYIRGGHWRWDEMDIAQTVWFGRALFELLHDAGNPG